MGLELLAVPMAKEVSRGFSCTLPGEIHMDRAAGWTHPELPLLCSSLPKYLMEPKHDSLGSL